MVDQVNDAPRSRRALLTAAAAAGAATVATAVARPLPVLAAGNDGNALTVGGFFPDARSQTTLANDNNNQIVLWVASNDDGLGNGSGTGTAVVGFSSHGRGVHGWSNADGQGVRAESTSGTGLHAKSTSGSAVRAEATSGVGVYASSDNLAIYAYSTAGGGAFIQNYSSGSPAIFGLSNNGATGVQGHANGNVPDARANTGVMGTADAAGTGGYFASPTGNAIRVEGKASFSRAGRASVPKNASHVDVAVPGGLAATAFVVATLQLPRAGVWVSSARINYPSAGKVRIQLNKVASTIASTPVGWFAIG